MTPFEEKAREFQSFLDQLGYKKIIYCRECYHHKGTYCAKLIRATDPDGFCNYGRKEPEEGK